MGHYVHLHVCFPCDSNDGVAELAKRHLLLDVITNPEALQFLNELSKRRGANPGPKGGLSIWGIVGNWTDEEAFLEQLQPFWLELLSSEIDGGPCSFEHVLVFVEHEQSEQATAFEIFLDDGLAVKKHPCPFAWMLA